MILSITGTLKNLYCFNFKVDESSPEQSDRWGLPTFGVNLPSFPDDHHCQDRRCQGEQNEGAISCVFDLSFARSGQVFTCISFLS